MKRLPCICGLILAALAAAAETLSPEAFLERVRYPQTGRSMAVLSGVMQHMREGGKMETVPIRLGLLIGPDGTRGQLILAEDEDYRIEQTPNKDAGGKMKISVRPARPLPPETARLRRYGLNPTDLTMGFVHYDFRRELAESRVKGLPCRVLVLSAPDGETARAYILRDHFFPLKVEFFADEKTAVDGTRPLRTMEVGSFRRKNGLYYAEVVDLRGPDWRSRVTFDRADLSVPPAGMPPPFREPKPAK